ncbi:uncharacterized protein LOC122310210 [Carya illinoinensis]|uniref:uncharacterized protein LOC122310210 n=1 Tax=Carya illinoinensis TaxID=32201 RepID=UPI001C71CB60|nr:uncharacterized protein LOC122310210 [Carya illinoinensis]
MKNCLGAMDDTMILAAAPAHPGNAYRNRHGRIAQNILCACDFDMNFTYVYTGCEGTTHDARIFLDALSRPDNQFTWPASGYYYLVDAAFPCIEMFMPPYPRERYHRSGCYNEDGFQGYKDYFNYRHSSLRNIIERTFSLLKRRFRILYAMPPYRPVRQGMIITACCTLYNMIKIVTPNDEIIQGISNHRSEMQNSSTENESGETSHVVDMSSESAQAMGAMRDAIALPMWAHRFGQ